MIEQDAYIRRILIIDDNDAIHEDFRRVLMDSRDDSQLLDLEASCFGTDEPQKRENLHFTLAHAQQGEAGVQMVEEAIAADEPFDLAFVDMRMPPGWDGLKTIQELWKVDPELETVICTAYSDHSWAEIVSRLGQSHHLLILKKPFDNAEVLQMALGLTEKRRLGRIAALKMDQIASLVVERTRELNDQKLQSDAMLRDLMAVVGDEKIPAT